jgi:hypothetical protein
MKVAELLGAIGENQDYYIVTADRRPEVIDVKTAVEHDANVLGIVAVRENLIRIETNFKWYL